MFFEKLEKEIKKKGITMNKLAKNAGFSQANTDRWKKGSMPNTDALIKICRYLNVSADYLLDLDDEAPPPDITELEQQNITFYEKLEKLLQQKEISLNRLAKDLQIAQSPTSRWKNGTLPSLSTFQKICKYLNVSADYLLDLNNGAPPPILTDQEQELLEHFRQCKKGTKESILLLAQSGAEQAKQQEALLNSQNAG